MLVRRCSVLAHGATCKEDPFRTSDRAARNEISPLSAANRLEKLFDFAKDKTSAIIEAFKDRVDSNTAEVLKKLHEALTLLKDTSAKAKEAGRAKLLELLESDGLEKALSKLPKKVQAELRRQCEALKEALEKGLETDGKFQEDAVLKCEPMSQLVICGQRSKELTSV